MRALFVMLAVLTIGACSQQTGTPLGCAHEATRALTWSDSGAPDTLTARSEGPSCTQAIVTFSLRNANGDPLWVFASTFYDMSVGGSPPPDAPPTQGADIQRFLASWIDVRETSSDTLPQWSEGMSRPGEGVEPLGYATAFERDVYEAIRARALPTICYAAAAEAVQCLIIDPASQTPALIVAYGP